MVMKNKNAVKVGAFIVSAVSVGALTVLFLTQSQINAKVVNTPSSLKDVSALELPAVAAQIVAQAPQEKRAEVAAETIRMAARFAKPGTLAFVAGSISQTTPDVASVVLSEAINAKPDEILPLTKASLDAAPSKVEDLVKAAVNARPEYFSLVARLADKEVPNKTQQILNGVKAGLPQLNVHIDKAVAAVTANTVSGVMEYVEKSTIAEAKSQMAENQRNQILMALENQNTPSTVAESPQIVKRATADNSSKLSDLPDNKTKSDAVKSILSGPTIIPVTPPSPPLYNIKPSDTTVVQPGSGRDYSAP